MTENKIWEEMEIPQELDSAIIEAVGKGRLLMGKRKRKRWRAAAMATAAACFTAVAIGFIDPVVARAYSNIPVIGNIFSYLYHTADAEIPYAQVMESAVPVKENDGTDQGDRGQQEGPAHGEEAAAQDSVQLDIKEYFCDGYSLYLSFEVVSEEPFMEGMADIAGKEGSIFLYSAEHITTGTGERFAIGDGSLIMKGIFSDEHTFVGIARSGGSLEGYPISDGMLYEVGSAYMRVFAGETETDIQGDWNASAEIACTAESLMTKELGIPIRGNAVLKEVKVQPYEIQAVIEVPKEGSLAAEDVVIEAFDDKGRRLNQASQDANRFAQEGDGRLEIWMFEKPEDAESVAVFALDGSKWMDEWKGYLYCDEPWSGERMTEFLKENSIAYGEAELP